MEKHNKVFYIYLFSAVIIYILIYIPSYHVPFHSDDYLFYMRGISLEALFRHYMTWEGRLIGDYIGALLLHFFSRPVYMAINSFVFLLVVVNISFIPALFFHKSTINEDNVILLWTAFLLYWVCNPCLGQTSFWIVGSVIYMWPLMWAGYYIICLLRLLQNNCYVADARNFIEEQQSLIQQNDSKRMRELFWIVLTGFLAGLSNEATGATVVFLTAVLYLVFRYATCTAQLRKNKLCFKKKTVILQTGFVSTLFGFLILFLAPGNFARFHWIGFSEWQNSTLIEKILYHVYERIPWAISQFWFAFLLLAILLLVLLSSNIIETLTLPEYKNLKIKCFIIPIIFIVTSALSVIAANQIQYKRILLLLIFITYELLAYISFQIYRLKRFVKADCKTIMHFYGITLLFFAMAIFSVLIFIVSPFMPERVLNTFNFYIILVIVMLISGVYRQVSDKRKKYCCIGVVFLLTVPYFLFSYIRFTYAIMQTKVQAAIREEIIATAKVNQNDQVEIPDWYFTKLAKETDKFDLFRSDAMPAYYGIKQIKWNPAYFNYAILKTKKPIITGIQVTDTIKMDCYHFGGYCFFDDASLVFGFDCSPLLLTDKTDSKIFFMLYLMKEKSVSQEPIVVEQNVATFTKVENHYYYAIKTPKNFKVQDIKRIDIALDTAKKAKVLFTVPVFLKK